MLALADYEAGVHDLCGLHDSIAMTDPHVEMTDRTCPICAALAAALRERSAREHDAEKDLAPSAPRAEDGRTTSVRLVSLGEAEKPPRPA